MNSSRLIILKRWLLAILPALMLPANLAAEEIKPDNTNTTHIVFKRIEPNNFHIKKDHLTIEVNKSASFLLLPFEEIKHINSISLQWKKQGKINVRDAQHEETREGDDAYLRMGLVIAGNPIFDNPLAPKWVKQVRETLYHPSDNMIYLVAGSQHESGQYWESPYSKNVKIIAMGSEKQKDGWYFSEYTLENNQPVVGLWIMADGDNTQSSFTTNLKALKLN
jgi:hypothetical protein